MIIGKRNLTDAERAGAARLLATLLFAVLFSVGLIAAFSYGQPWDESTEIDIFLSNMKEYSARAGLKGEPAETLESLPVPRISESPEKDHGAAAYYAFFPVYLAARSSARNTMYAWHIYTFCIFFSGVWAVYLILRELFSHPLIPFGGMLSYFLTPRFFAEGHYNNKDIVFASILLWMLFFLIKSAKAPGWRYLVPYSCASAFLMNCRVSGLALWGLGFFFLVLYQVLRKKPGSVYGKAAAALLLSLLFYYALTPAGWGRPVQFLRYCLENAAHFGRWDRVVLFNGHMMQPAKYGLPYSYLPVWMLITVPEHVLALFMISCGLYGIRLIKAVSARLRRRPAPACHDRDFFLGMLLLFFWLPFLYLVCKSHTMVLYNGWRHCYFLYVPMILLSLYALEPLPGERARRNLSVRSALLSGILALGLLSVTADLIHYHPYEYVYFNRLGRASVSTDGFEGDYWNVSTLGVLRHFEEEYYRGEKLKVALMEDAGQGQARSLLNSDKVQIVEEKEADYYLFNYSGLHDRSVLEGYEPVSWIERGGSLISGVYVKTGN